MPLCSGTGSSRSTPYPIPFLLVSAVSSYFHPKLCKCGRHPRMQVHFAFGSHVLPTDNDAFDWRLWWSCDGNSLLIWIAMVGKQRRAGRTLQFSYRQDMAETAKLYPKSLQARRGIAFVFALSCSIATNPDSWRLMLPGPMSPAQASNR